MAMKDPEDRRVLEKMNKVGGLTLPNFKTYSKVLVIKILWYWEKNKLGDWDRVQSPEIYLYNHGQLLFNKISSTVQQEKGLSFQQMIPGQVDIHMEEGEEKKMKKRKSRRKRWGKKIFILTSHYIQKSNSKCITDLNIRFNNIELPEERMRISICMWYLMQNATIRCNCY